MGTDVGGAGAVATAAVIKCATKFGVLGRAVELGVAKAVLLDPIRLDPYLENVFPRKAPPRDKPQEGEKKKPFPAPGLK